MKKKKEKRAIAKAPIAQPGADGAPAAPPKPDAH